MQEEYSSQESEQALRVLARLIARAALQDKGLCRAQQSDAAQGDGSSVPESEAEMAEV